MKTGHRGAVPVLVLYILGALGATQLVPNWRITTLFSKGPGTEALRKAQDEASKAKADAAAAQSKYETALLEQKTKTIQQGQYSQQMVAGIPLALARAPQTPEVVFATGLAKRASTGLAAALGDLPPDKQSEISFLVEQALSAKQAEVDAAKAALAQKDAELAATTAEKKIIEAKLPVLENQAKQAEIKAVTAEGLVAVKTNQVAQYADKMADKEREAGSLETLVHKLVIVIVVIGIIYAFVHFVLPSLAQEFPAAQRLVSFNRAVKSVFSSHA